MSKDHDTNSNRISSLNYNCFAKNTPPHLQDESRDCTFVCPNVLSFHSYTQMTMKGLRVLKFTQA